MKDILTPGVKRIRQMLQMNTSMREAQKGVSGVDMRSKEYWKEYRRNWAREKRKI
jgi:hypothetical protein